MNTTTESCPICGREYLERKPNRFGGTDYIHSRGASFTEMCHFAYRSGWLFDLSAGELQRRFAAIQEMSE